MQKGQSSALLAILLVAFVLIFLLLLNAPKTYECGWTVWETFQYIFGFRELCY